MQLPHAFVLVALLVVSSLDAQTPKYRYSPAGAEKEAGGVANFVANWPPWQAGSVTYQQIHDYAEMVRVAGGSPTPFVMKGLGFRPAGKGTLQGRSWDLRLSLGHCPNPSTKPSTTFSANLPKPTVVFGTSTKFTTFSFKTVTGTKDPNPIAFTVPFNNSYVWVFMANNHFCWEWRHLNASSNALMTCDFASGQFGPGSRLASIGKGCNAWSDITLPALGNNYHYISTLSGAPANTRAMAMLGIVKQQTKLPGWCKNLETIPLTYIFGQTNGAGSMSFRGPNSALKGVPQFTLYVQYAFVDSRKPFGVGLSTTSAYRTNLPGGWNMARLFNTVWNTNLNTYANATTASANGVEVSFGLVVGFLR